MKKIGAEVLDEGQENSVCRVVGGHGALAFLALYKAGSFVPIAIGISFLCVGFVCLANVPDLVRRLICEAAFTEIKAFKYNWQQQFRNSSKLKS